MKKKTWRELFWYLVFGVATTLVDAAVYYPIVALVHGRTEQQNALIATGAKALAWVAAVLFAFFTNKKWVFTDERWDRGTFWKQLGSFTAARLLTLGLSLVITYFGVLWLEHWPWFRSLPWVGDRASQVIWVLQSVVTVVLNYVLSKLFVFRKKKTDQDS